MAPVRTEVLADRSGFVRSLGAIRVGVAAVHLGAGRRAKEDEIDHAVGILCRKKRGDAVEAGEPLAEIHARNEAAGSEAADQVAAAYELGDEPPRARPIILDVLG